jgi:hypothetical protein
MPYCTLFMLKSTTRSHLSFCSGIYGKKELQVKDALKSPNLSTGGCSINLKMATIKYCSTVSEARGPLNGKQVV